MPETAARLRYQCRRGMLELDAILQPFFEHHFKLLTLENQRIFERLLTCNDQELYHWFIGHDLPEDTELRHLVLLIKSTF